MASVHSAFPISCISTCPFLCNAVQHGLVFVCQTAALLNEPSFFWTLNDIRIIKDSYTGPRNGRDLCTSGAKSLSRTRLRHCWLWTTGRHLAPLSRSCLARATSNGAKNMEKFARTIVIDHESFTVSATMQLQFCWSYFAAHEPLLFVADCRKKYFFPTSIENERFAQ